MPTSPIDPATGPSYVLFGRVVTMAKPEALEQEVIEQGAIFVENGRIRAVQPEKAPQPTGFGKVPRVDAGDTIFPGLIDLHNHLSYNAMPLWRVPKQYSNNGQWRNHPDYQRLITKPCQVLGRTDGVAQALIRFVECRALLGGVTSSQGITLAGTGVDKLYKGLVRNVEQTADPTLPAAHPIIANPKKDGASAYLGMLRKETCVLQHLSEGTDETARSWFLTLRLPDDEWALNENFCGIHSTALLAEDFAVLKAHRAAVVWSPLSNLLLYGDTLRIREAKEAGILMGLGSDWGPSGSKNLLGELKVAWLVSQERGNVFTERELVAMVTSNAARILKWQDEVGTIEPGRRADLVCINGQKGDPYRSLLEARETGVTLVVINGVARVGQPELMKKFGSDYEAIRVGGSQRLLNVRHPVADALLGPGGLAQATSILADAMKRLPELAARLDQGWVGGELVSGSANAPAAAPSVQVRFEFEEEPSELDLAMAAVPLAELVQPMQLDPITVADDARWFARLMAVAHLPRYIQEKLPGLFGQPVPKKADTGPTASGPESLPADVSVTDLASGWRESGTLTRDQLGQIVAQCLLVLEQNYVHLPFKKAMHAVDPVQRLKLLGYRLEEPAGRPLSELEVHAEIARTFLSLRDLHTTYQLPEPFRSQVAWLPFMVEEFWEAGQRKFMISKVVGQPADPALRAGIELLHWNGVPIEHAIALNAERLGGSNEDARWARGLDAMTMRPLAHGMLPDEQWVDLEYRDESGAVRSLRQPWLLSRVAARHAGVDPEGSALEATALGLDSRTEAIQAVKARLFASEAVARHRDENREYLSRPFASGPADLETHLPTLFRARTVETPSGMFGYVRIFTFNTADASAFVNEFVRLVTQLPADGLILDIRGNPGGLIYAAERLIQVLTGRHVTPAPAQFVNTPLNLRLCRAHSPSHLYRDLDLSKWAVSMATAVKTGAGFSLAFPVTSEAQCNDVGQSYFGPVVLITDALSYSAADIFAASFQDHEVGPVLGVHGNTGAGGANVWSHSVLETLARGAAGSSDTAAPDSARSPYAPLPGGASLTVAIRRFARVGQNAGILLEDLGVEPDCEHQMTRNDLLQNNRDLLARAALLLSQQPRSVLGAAVLTDEGGRRLELVTRNLDRVDAYVDGRPTRSLTVRDGRQDCSAALPGDMSAGTLELRGFRADRLALVRRVKLGA
jgi:cytosine/adenosine deaminase-related metal-dependent hydrolase